MKLYRRKEDFNSLWLLKHEGIYKNERYVILEELHSKNEVVDCITISKSFFDGAYERLVNLKSYKEVSEFSDSELLEELKSRNLPISIIENPSCIMYSASSIEDSYNRHFDYFKTMVNYCIHADEKVIDNHLMKNTGLNNRMKKYRVHYEEV